MRPEGGPVGRAFRLFPLLALPACAPLSAAFAPVPVIVHSPSEVQEAIGADSGRVAFSDDAILRTPTGVTIRGAGAILEFLSGRHPSGYHGIRMSTARVYRCGAARGLEIGQFAGNRRQDGISRAVTGRWGAEWTRGSTGEWLITVATLYAPGRRPSPAGRDCVELAAEIRARSRLTLSLHASKLGYYTADPREGDYFWGPYPVRDRSIGRGGALVSARYRIGRWLGVAAHGEVMPRFKTWFRDSRTLSDEYLTVTGSFASLSAMYDGRNVSFAIGPAVYRSRWLWDDESPFPTEAAFTGLGAVSTMHVLIPLGKDLGLDLVGQYRAFGNHPVRPGETVPEGSYSGFFFGIGFAMRANR